MRKVQIDFQAFRQAKPKSNPKKFGLGFFFAKVQYIVGFAAFFVPRNERKIGVKGSYPF